MSNGCGFGCGREHIEIGWCEIGVRGGLHGGFASGAGVTNANMLKHFDSNVAKKKGTGPWSQCKEREDSSTETLRVHVFWYTPMRGGMMR